MCRIFALLCCAAILGLPGCHSIVQGKTGHHHHPFFRTQWPVDAVTTTNRGPATSTSRPDTVRLRRMFVAAARQQMSTRPTSTADHGFGIIRQSFSDIGLNACGAYPDLSRMVDHSRRIDAYQTRGNPVRGDILLFHHTRNLNQNGQDGNDVTGAAIVIDHNRSHYYAITRTGPAPRRIVITPRNPDIHRRNETVFNSFIRQPFRTDPPDSKYLTGQLMAGYIDIHRWIANCAVSPK